MGEVAVALAAFTEEYEKFLRTVPASGTARVTWKQSKKLTELFEHYAARLPEPVRAPTWLDAAERLAERKEAALALQLCYGPVLGLALLQGGGGGGDAQAPASTGDAERDVLLVRARYGAASCRAAVLREDDPDVHRPATLEGLLACLADVQQACVVACEHQANYWLVVNGTCHIYELAMPLCVSGFPREVAPFLAFCCDTVLPRLVFWRPKFLPWIVQLCRATAHCHADAGDAEAARRIVESYIARLGDIRNVMEFDPVPPSIATTEAYDDTKSKLLELQFKHTAQGLDAGAVKAAYEGLDGGKGGEARRVTALADAICVGRNFRAARPGAASADVAKLLDTAATAIEPHVAAMEAVAQRQADDAAKAAAAEAAAAAAAAARLHFAA